MAAEASFYAARCCFFALLHRARRRARAIARSPLLRAFACFLARLLLRAASRASTIALRCSALLMLPRCLLVWWVGGWPIIHICM